MTLIQEIQERWSPRAFSETPVFYKDLDSSFEAARWAASSMNEQPWRFIAATKSEDPELWNNLFNALVEGNQTWAKNAPALVMVVAKNNFVYKNRPNFHAAYDTGAAAAQFVLQATKEGLYVHQMGGFVADRARDTMNIGDGFTPIAMLAVGYKGDPETLPDALKQRELAPRSRKPIGEIVFKGRL